MKHADVWLLDLRNFHLKFKVRLHYDLQLILPLTRYSQLRACCRNSVISLCSIILTTEQVKR